MFHKYIPKKQLTTASVTQTLYISTSKLGILTLSYDHDPVRQDDPGRTTKLIWGIADKLSPKPTANFLLLNFEKIIPLFEPCRVQSEATCATLKVT